MMKTTARRRRPQVEALEGRTLLNAGDLDLTFGGTGIVSTQLPTDATSIGVAVQPDLKVVLAGQSLGSNPAGGQHITLTRYNVDGSLDTTFGTGGIDFLPISTGNKVANQDDAHAVAIQPDGKIVVAGEAYFDGTKKGTYADDWVVVRLNPNGTLDTTFGGGKGYVTTAFYNAISSPAPVAAQAIVIQPDGKIVVGGQAATDQSVQALGVVRYNSNGSLDTGFGTGGKVINTGIAWNGYGQMVAIDTAARIDVVGIVNSTTQKMGVARYLPNGTPDSTFGSGGLVTLLPAGSTTAQAHAIGVQSTGKIVVYGPATFPSSHALVSTLVRLNTDGSLDSTFGTGGIYAETRLSFGYSIAIQPGDDKIVAVSRGWVNGSVSPHFWVTRVLADGSSYDPTFGTSGLAMASLGGTSTELDYGVALAPDGKVVVTGQVNNGSSLVFAAARFLGDPPAGSDSRLMAGHVTPPATATQAPATAIVPLVLGSLDLFPATAKRGRKSP